MNIIEKVLKCEPLTRAEEATIISCIEYTALSINTRVNERKKFAKKYGDWTMNVLIKV